MIYSTGLSSVAPREEMRIPKEPTEALVATFVALLILGFLAMAFINLSKGRAVLPSTLWIGLVATIVFAGRRVEGGWRQFCVNRLGSFASHQFVESADGESAQPALIRLGYCCWGRRFHYLELPIARIHAVTWGPGQATYHAGKDMSDWSVALWYASDSTATPDGRDEVFIVGPETPREDAEKLGQQLIAFLERAGVRLDRTGPAKGAPHRESSDSV